MTGAHPTTKSRETGIIVFWNTTDLKKLTLCDNTSHLFSSSIEKPAKAVYGIRVLLNWELNASSYIWKVAYVYLFRLRKLRQLRSCLNKLAIQRLLFAWFYLHIFLCNKVLAELASVTITNIAACKKRCYTPNN